MEGDATLDRKPRIVLREKKRGSAARVAMKEQWRNSTNMLDSIYLDIAKTIPSVEAMSTLDLRKVHNPSSNHVLNTGTLPAPSNKRIGGNFTSYSPMSSTLIGKRSQSLAQLGATTSTTSMESPQVFDRKFTSCGTESSSSSRVEMFGLADMIEEIKPKAKELCKVYEELSSLVNLLAQWQVLIQMNKVLDDVNVNFRRIIYFQKLPSSVRKQTELPKKFYPRNTMTSSTASDELDDNVLLANDVQ